MSDSTPTRSLDLAGLREQAQAALESAQPKNRDGLRMTLPPAVVLVLVDAIEAADSKLTSLRERVARGERERQDAERWQHVRRFLSVERDLADHVEYLYWGETEEVQAPIGDHTVESLIDFAIAAARRSDPDAVPVAPSEPRDQ